MEHRINIDGDTAAAANTDRRSVESGFNGPPTRLSAIYMDSGEVHDRAEFSTLNFRNLNQREANRDTLSESRMYELRMARSGNGQGASTSQLNFMKDFYSFLRTSGASTENGKGGAFHEEALSTSSEAGESVQSQWSNTLNAKSLDSNPPANIPTKKSAIVVSKEIHSGFLSGESTTGGPCNESRTGNGNGNSNGNGNGWGDGDAQHDRTPTNTTTLLLLLAMFLGFGSVLVVFVVTFVKVRGYNLEELSVVSILLCGAPACLICVWCWKRFWQGVSLRCGNRLEKKGNGESIDAVYKDSSKLVLTRGPKDLPV